MLVRSLCLAIISAVAITPLSGIAWEFGRAVIYGGSAQSGKLAGLALVGVNTGMMALLIVVPFLMFYAVPLFLFLRHYRRVTLVTCIVSSLVPCIALAFLYGEPMIALVTASYAVPCAVIFWYCVRRVAEKPLPDTVSDSEA